MLYITTRDDRDAYTAYRTLNNQYGPCGGRYIPFRTVSYSQEEIASFLEKSFSQCVAEILNLFFSARLDSWDVDFCIGRRPVKLVPMSHKIVIAECWNNPDWDLYRTVRNLKSRIMGNTASSYEPTDWSWIAVRIALLFGIFAEMNRIGIADTDRRIDVSVCAGDFSAPMAVWYARQMGLPIGNIIFTCNENSGPWDLLHHGELHTASPVRATVTPMCDWSVPVDLERLIYGVFGKDETARYLEICRRKGVYTLTDAQAQTLRNGMFGAVISQKRMESVIRNVYKTRTYLLGPYSAMAYGGLQDYRATNTDAAPALIITEQGPQCAPDQIAQALGIDPALFKDRINRI